MKEFNIEVELEKAALQYGIKHTIMPEDCNDGDNPYYEEMTAEAFKAGAEWMKKIIITPEQHSSN